MSDLSHAHCKKCRQPDYCCDCDEPDMIESVTNIVMRKEKPPKDHPFFDHHPNLFKRK